MGKGNSSCSPYLLAHSDTSTTKNAQVIITIKEGLIPLDRQILISIWKSDLVNADIASNILQLAVLIFGAGNTALGYSHIAQAYVKGPTIFNSVAGQARVRMLAKNQFQDTSPELGNFGGISMNHHIIGSRGSAGWR
ncbi:hypothetical protein ES703_81013 [subsurface metagenome]